VTETNVVREPSANFTQRSARTGFKLCELRPPAAIWVAGGDEKEHTMPTIVAHHNLTKGSKHWLTSHKRKEFFGPLGVTNIRTFVDPQNPNRAAVMMDVPDMDALTAAMQTKAAADAMAFDGVVPESLVVLVES
jgi:hypothetical protein